MRILTCFLVAVILISCDEPDKKTLFESVSPEETDVNRRNDLAFDKEFNIYTYRKFYNGGGVGAADINNDGLTDLYFTRNQAENKLFLNKGNLQFEDIPKTAGVGGTKAW